MQEEGFKVYEADVGAGRMVEYLVEREGKRKSVDSWSAGVNDDRVDSGGILSTEADRISRKPWSWWPGSCCMRILSWEHQECDKFPCAFSP